MNVNGRRVRQAANGNRHIAKLCGKHLAGGRRMYRSTSTTSIHEAIERERRTAARMLAAKGKKKKK